VPVRPAGFATTSWSVVVAARDGDAAQAREALATLCETYWYPLYAFIRRQGNSAQEAEDLTQEFFSRLLEKDFLEGVDRSRGKFRSFLLAACGHFLSNERDRARAWKRGGRCRIVSLDFAQAETQYALEAADRLSPDKLFARRWALTLLRNVLSRLRADYAARGKAALFDRLRVSLLGEDSEPAASLAAALGMTAGAVRVAVHRLRQQFRELLREEIARTVDRPEEIEEEMRDLFTAFGS
jgi:RNA polymerase sigma-70 factor (ECF subfamily)